MRRTDGAWRVAAAVAVMAGCLGVVLADEPPPSTPPPAEQPSAFEQLFAPKSSAKKPRRKTVTRKSAPAAPAATTPSPLFERMADIPWDELQRGTLAPRRIIPTSFTSKEGIEGWKVVVAGGQSLATPAVDDGKLFIGGGCASREFYALSADTGKLLWRHDSADSGPTAPVVDRGYISYSTESCTLEVLTGYGKQVWKKRLGPHLLTMPAIVDGRVIASFPGESGRRHFVASFLLNNGEEVWRTSLANEIIAAPVIDGQRVLVATADGTLHCLDARNGEVTWTQEQQNATSTPTVWKDHCWFSRRQNNVASRAGTLPAQTERMARRGLDAGGAVYDLAVTSRPANYLALGKNSDVFGNVGRAPAGRRDASGTVSTDVASAIPPDAFSSASSGVSRGRPANRALIGLWNYQGSRPLFYDGRLYAAMGDSLSCVDVDNEKVIWNKEYRPAKERNAPPKRRGPLARAPYGPYACRDVTQPALVNHKVFIGTSSGEVLCLSAATGDLLWKATVGSPVESQPLVVGGRVYVTTASGALYCLNTGDRKDDGWRMWGADAAHTGKVREAEPEQAGTKETPLASCQALRN
jgi:outer membrane protein assembly factor BamB